MLIISNGMPKSASSLMYYYTQQLIRELHADNGCKFMEELIEAGELPGRGCFVQVLDESSIDKLLGVCRRYGPTVVKAHHELTPFLAELIRKSVVAVTFTYRDRAGNDLGPTPAPNQIKIVDVLLTVAQQLPQNDQPVSRTYSARIICRNLVLQ